MKHHAAPHFYSCYRRLPGQHVCVARLQGSCGVLTVIVHSALRSETEELMLDVGGLDSTSTEHLTWERSELVVGDELRIIVEENANTTGPNHRIPVGGAAESEAELNASRQAAGKLGYDLVKRTA